MSKFSKALERGFAEGGAVNTTFPFYQDGEYTASAYGTAAITPDPDAPNFVPYDQLIEADVLAWVWASEDMDKDEMEANLAAKIEADKNPTTATGTPW